jgi:hypothetical protein
LFSPLRLPLVFRQKGPSPEPILQPWKCKKLDRCEYAIRHQQDEIVRLRAELERRDEELTQLLAWIKQCDEEHRAKTRGGEGAVPTQRGSPWTYGGGHGFFEGYIYFRILQGIHDCFGVNGLGAAVGATASWPNGSTSSRSRFAAAQTVSACRDRPTFQNSAHLVSESYRKSRKLY